ncbi:MAG: CoA pyrophosphatase [Gammaproteobacteria bacterium]|nr:CoA pyrophosphatase [Gammaproteobacteria bacterium]
MRLRIIRQLQQAAEPGIPGDLPLREALPAGAGLVSAAVLVPLVDHSAGMTVLLTQRTRHLRDHAGQVSFPGGRVEAHDADPVATALRETWEEVGLAPAQVEVVGELEPYATITGFLVHPVVGIVTPGFIPVPDPFEVEAVFEVPLQHVLEPDNYRRERRSHRGELREYFVLDYPDFHIWGATAAILVNLRRRLAGV